MKSYKNIVFYSVWRFYNEYGCSILIALCFPLEYVNFNIALAAEIQWHVVGGPSKRGNDWQHSRAIIGIRVGWWHLPMLQVYALNVHHEG